MEPEGVTLARSIGQSGNTNPLHFIGEDTEAKEAVITQLADSMCRMEIRIDPVAPDRLRW